LLESYEKERYSRQILFAEIGEEGQERLLVSTAVIAGCGALGTAQADALARAGVGRLVVIDRDYVEPSNLQRQSLFDEADAREVLPKAVAAARHLSAVNSGIRIEPVVADLTARNAESLLRGADVILDGADNFELRYLINDWAVKNGVPWIYGAAVGSYGVTMPVLPDESACLACLLPEPPGGPRATCDTAGILNTVTSIIAALQVADATKILAGRAECVEPRLFSMDVWKNTHRVLSSRERDPKCSVCGDRKFEHLESSKRRPVSLCGRNAVQIHEREEPIDLERLARTLEPLGTVSVNPYALRFAVDPYQMTIFLDGRAIIKGTEDAGVARSLYARYVGN
jgi:molybdopterin/thiamine biosynthesis adenylyltransferase